MVGKKNYYHTSFTIQGHVQSNEKSYWKKVLCPPLLRCFFWPSMAVENGLSKNWLQFPLPARPGLSLVFFIKTFLALTKRSLQFSLPTAALHVRPAGKKICNERHFHSANHRGEWKWSFFEITNFLTKDHFYFPEVCVLKMVLQVFSPTAIFHMTSKGHMAQLVMWILYDVLLIYVYFFSIMKINASWTQVYLNEKFLCVYQKFSRE